MKTSKLQITILAFLAMYISLLMIQCDKSDIILIEDLSPDIEAIKNYINAEDYAKNWALFPESKALKRLGLPVHGRWVTTYVNDIAHNFILGAIDKKLDQPLEFPEGSIIVKENYSTNFMSTDSSINSGNSKLQVITLLFKPHAKHGFCATPKFTAYEGADCYGGNWFYGFYFLKEPVAGLNDSIQSNVQSFCINCHAPAYNTDYVRSLDNILNPFADSSSLAYCDRFTPPLVKDPIKTTGEGSFAKKINDYISNNDLSPDVPADVPADPSKVLAELGKEKTQAMFDSYAWKSFIALCWPNENSERGKANKSLPFNSNLNQSMVWETYKPTFEVFQPTVESWNPKDQDWNQDPPVIVGDGCNSDFHEFVITMGSKGRDVANETGQAFAGSFGNLIDQDSSMVRYEVLFNRTEFEFLIANDRASSTNITPAGPRTEVNTVWFPDTKDDSKYNEGSIEIKSAWKELCLDKTCHHQDADNIEAAKKKFLVRKALIYNADSSNCHIADMALVGLHIARKTYFAPQWIWITFEHKDNAPDAGQKTPTGTFYNPKLTELENCYELPFLFPKPEVAACPNVDLNRFIKELKNSPNQITRLVPIDSVADKLNQAFHNSLSDIDSPFANYILVDTQWPLNGRNKKGEVNKLNCSDNGIGDDCFTSIPRFLRNTVIESYMANYCEVDGEVGQFSNRSCMSCHGSAGADLSYIWLDAASQRVTLKDFQ